MKSVSGLYNGNYHKQCYFEITHIRNQEGRSVPSIIAL